MDHLYSREEVSKSKSRSPTHPFLGHDFTPRKRIQVNHPPPISGPVSFQSLYDTVDLSSLDIERRTDPPLVNVEGEHAPRKRAEQLRCTVNKDLLDTFEDNIRRLELCAPKLEHYAEQIGTLLLTDRQLKYIELTGQTMTYEQKRLLNQAEWSTCEDITGLINFLPGTRFEPEDLDTDKGGRLVNAYYENSLGHWPKKGFKVKSCKLLTRRLFQDKAKLYSCWTTLKSKVRQIIDRADCDFFARKRDYEKALAAKNEAKSQEEKAFLNKLGIFLKAVFSFNLHRCSVNICKNTVA